MKTPIVMKFSNELDLLCCHGGHREINLGLLGTQQLNLTQN